MLKQIINEVDQIQPMPVTGYATVGVLRYGILIGGGYVVLYRMKLSLTKSPTEGKKIKVSPNHKPRLSPVFADDTCLNSPHAPRVTWIA